MRKTSRNYYSPEKVRELLDMAKDSISLDFIEGVCYLKLNLCLN